jgi:hypothetical protein
MLEDAQGVNCQASNFSRAFSATPQGESIFKKRLMVASALGLMDANEIQEKPTLSYGSLIQNFNRWLLSILTVEAVVEGDSFSIRSEPQEAGTTPNSAFNQVMGVDLRTTNTCGQCGHVSARDSILNVVDLAYPRKVSSVLIMLMLSCLKPRPFQTCLDLHWYGRQVQRRIAATAGRLRILIADGRCLLGFRAYRLYCL